MHTSGTFHFFYNPCEVKIIFLIFTDEEMESKRSIALIVLKLSVYAFASPITLYSLSRQGPVLFITLF